MTYLLIALALLLLLENLPKILRLFHFKKKIESPKILYKYIHPDAIRYYLNDFTISFTNYQYLNDPLETSIQNTLDFTKKEISYPQWNPESLSFWSNYSMTKAGMSYEDRYEKTRKEYESIKSNNDDLNWKIKTLERCRDELGILSLTTNQYNPVMWAHYANNHKGICIGFDMTHSFFKPSDSIKHFHSSSKIFSLLGIKYKSLRPSYAELSLEDYIITAFSTKRIEWSYEKEYRLLRPINTDIKVRRVEKCPSIIFKEIYLGLQCKIDDNLLKNLGDSVKVHKIEQVKDSYELRSTEINRS